MYFINDKEFSIINVDINPLGAEAVCTLLAIKCHEGVGSIYTAITQLPLRLWPALLFNSTFVKLAATV